MKGTDLPKTWRFINWGSYMYRDKRIAVVVPAYNEENKIGPMLDGLPDIVDTIYVIDDCSTDRTPQVIQERAARDPRIMIIRHERNKGVGAAIATGYMLAAERDDDVAVVMAGDGQMNPDELPSLLDPVIEDKADYVKGNRFFHRVGVAPIPLVRLVGNLALSSLTKVVSGYWHIFDTQCGYTAINREFLKRINWEEVYPRYGCPNDILTRLNVADARVADVPVSALYGKSWASKMKLWKIWPQLLYLLWSLLCMRIYRKYIYLNGHPLVACYTLGFLATLLSFLTFLILIVQCIFFSVSLATLILFSLFTVVASQLLLAACFMDYTENKHLCVLLKN